MKIEVKRFIITLLLEGLVILVAVVATIAFFVEGGFGPRHLRLGPLVVLPGLPWIKPLDEVHLPGIIEDQPLLLYIWFPTLLSVIAAGLAGLAADWMRCGIKQARSQKSALEAFRITLVLEGLVISVALFSTIVFFAQRWSGGGRGRLDLLVALPYLPWVEHLYKLYLPSLVEYSDLVAYVWFPTLLNVMVAGLLGLGADSLRCGIRQAHSQ